MIWANLDSLVRRTLLEKSMPIHYYAEMLFHASAAVRELSFDTLQIINTARIALNDYYAAELPNDFVDDLAVAIPAGNMLQKVAKNDNITPLRNKDSDGAFIPYGNTEEEDDGSEPIFGFTPSVWFWNFNDLGEPTGRNFGAGGGAVSNGYKVFKERRQIQMTETFSSDEIVLLYISDGQSSDNATQIDVQATAAIQAYINWKRSPNADSEFSPEGQAWYNQRRLLRARLNPLTPTDIKNTIRNHYRASIKN